MAESTRAAESRLVLEACVGSLESARAALEGGADRLELNRALDRDGLTPGEDLFAAVQAEVALPTIVMIRPHDRGYAYTPAEWAGLLEDVERFVGLGAAGVAVGALTSDGSVDSERLAEIVDAAGGREVVFHRAFDETPDQAEALERLIECGARRVLTSGGRPTAPEGVEELRRLVERAAGRIEILPGCGLRPGLVAPLLRATGCSQVHGTFGAGGPTDVRAVAAVRRELDALA